MANHKAIIETMINTTALALMAYGTNLLITDNVIWWRGIIIILFAMLIEFIKYTGRHKKLW